MEFESLLDKETLFNGEKFTLNGVEIYGCAGSNLKVVADYHSPYNTTDINYVFYALVDDIKTCVGVDDNGRLADYTGYLLEYACPPLLHKFNILSIIIDSIGWGKITCEKILDD